MHAVVRASLVALVFVAPLVRGAEEPLPAIFAPRERPLPAVLRRPPQDTAPVSERVRTELNIASYRALATAKPFDAPMMPTGRVSFPLAPDGDATLMQPFVVRSLPLVVQERPLPDAPLLDFLKTGRFYHNESMEVALKLFILQQTGLGWGREFTRGEVQFSFRW